MERRELEIGAFDVYVEIKPDSLELIVDQKRKPIVDIGISNKGGLRLYPEYDTNEFEEDDEELFEHTRGNITLEYSESVRDLVVLEVTDEKNRLPLEALSYAGGGFSYSRSEFEPDKFIIENLDIDMEDRRS
jgi:hypothetical protein